MKNITSLTPLYKRDVTGGTRIWTVNTGWDNDNYAGTRTVTGLVDGKLTTSKWNLKEPKNIGKKNSTTAKTQADAEALSAWEKKLETGYFKDIDKIDTVDKFKPMLAENYTKRPTSSGFSQPKLDGIRCIANRDGLWTRAGKAITSCPHIWNAVEWYFIDNPDAVIDGELYNHALKADFNKITSLVRKMKSTEDDFTAAAELVQYHVYDICLPDSTQKFSDRFNILRGLVSRDWPIHLVETTWCDNQEVMDKLYAQYTEDGYEGQMVRHDKPYEHKRSKSLLKRKEFTTEEFKVVEVVEGLGNWSGYVKRFVCEIPKNLDYPTGRTFGAGIRGTQKQLKELLESGKTPDWATIRYFNLTPDGIPRFPVVVDYGFGERED